MAARRGFSHQKINAITAQLGARAAHSSAPRLSQVLATLRGKWRQCRAVLNMQISVQKFDTDEQREGVKVPSVASICIFKWLKCGTWHPTQPAHTPLFLLPLSFSPLPWLVLCPVSGLLSRFFWLIKVRLNFERTSDKRQSGKGIGGRGVVRGKLGFAIGSGFACLTRKFTWLRPRLRLIGQMNLNPDNAHPARRQAVSQWVWPRPLSLPPSTSCVAKIVACGACVGQVKVLDPVTQTGSY